MREVGLLLLAHGWWISSMMVDKGEGRSGVASADVTDVENGRGMSNYANG